MATLKLGTKVYEVPPLSIWAIEKSAEPMAALGTEGARVPEQARRMLDVMVIAMTPSLEDKNLPVPSTDMLMKEASFSDFGAITEAFTTLMKESGMAPDAEDQKPGELLTDGPSPGMT